MKDAKINANKYVAATARAIRIRTLRELRVEMLTQVVELSVTVNLAAALAAVVML